MIRVAIAGTGGFAKSHHRAIRDLESEGLCTLVATCDPDPESGPNGLKCYPDYLEMIKAEEIDLVCLPTPVHLHAEQHRIAVEAGVQVYLEKPPTLWWPEFLSMIEVDVSALKKTNVGFNFIGDPFRRDLKQRILAGEFGKLESASLHAVWPRSTDYYERNEWAGSLTFGARWVLDSCIGNALAHYVENVLWLCGGPEIDQVASVSQVHAGLYRRHQITSFDTVLANCLIGDGIEFRIAATHTGEEHNFERERLTFELAEITFNRWDRAEVRWKRGGREIIESRLADGHRVLCHNLRETLAYRRGERERPITTLEDCLSFIALHTLCFASSGGIESIQSGSIERHHAIVEHLEKVLELFVEHKESPLRGIKVERGILEHFSEDWFDF